MSLNNLSEIDVLIVGAGPAGLACANHLCGKNLSVLMVEARNEIGKPLRCAEVSRPAYFESLGILPRKQWIRWELKETRDHLFVLNRSLMESEVVKLLLEKGIQVKTGTSVKGIGNYTGTGRTVRLSDKNGEHELFAKLVVAADGVSSLVARLTGLDTHLTVNEALPSLSYRFGGVKVRHKYYAETEFPEYLKPGFLWIIPCGEDQVNIGISIRGTEGFRLQGMLSDYIKKDDSFSQARLMEKIVGCYPFSLPLEIPYDDGILVTGTAARLVDARNGEGIYYAAESGRIAAQTFISTNFDSSADSLAVYRKQLEPMYNILRDIYHSKTC